MPSKSPALCVETTEVAPGVFLCRLCEGPMGHYRQMTVVVVDDAGETLRIYGWTGAPPGAQFFRDAKEKHFPAAKRALWFRLRGGELRPRRIEFMPTHA